MKELELSARMPAKSALNNLNEKKIQITSKLLLHRTAEVLRHWDDHKGPQTPREEVQNNSPKSAGVQGPEQSSNDVGGNDVFENDHKDVPLDDPADILLRRISTHMKKLQTRAYDMFREIDKDGMHSNFVTLNTCFIFPFQPMYGLPSF
jgi:hypothetical protein